MVTNNNNNGSWLNHTLFKTAISIIVLAAAAWGNWVTSTVTGYSVALARITERLVRIEQKLDDHLGRDDAKRHNP